MAEGTRLEPYSPCQGLVRGQGGLEDVQACVDLAVHLPVAHQAHELLAHPISAPGATHWAGLRRPCGIDFDDWHAREGGLVLDLTVNFTAGPGGEATVHPTGPTSRTVEGEVLQDDGGLMIACEPHESLRESVEPLANAIPFPPSFSTQKPTHDPPVAGLPPGEPPPATKVGLLNSPDDAERDAEEPLGRLGGRHAIPGV